MSNGYGVFNWRDAMLVVVFVASIFVFAFGFYSIGSASVESASAQSIDHGSRQSERLDDLNHCMYMWGFYERLSKYNLNTVQMQERTIEKLKDKCNE